jgi:mannose-6-phosphate isomerase-like protein (cupin superfamily)
MSESQTTDAIECIKANGVQYAIIIRNGYSKPGISFCTPDDYSQQLAYMRHPKGKMIDAHVHNVVKREILYTKEVLFIRKGRLRTDFYTDEQEFVSSVILEAGDCILLAAGGHGFECLEEVEMIEVKQGPYAGEGDKTRFIPKAREAA